MTGTFVAQHDRAKAYGSFTIGTDGAWSYTLDDGNGDVQALNVGGSLHELVTVKTADGTAKVIDITIEGANDAAVITGTATDRVREKGGIANGTAGAAMGSGNLNATDVDSVATFVAQTDAARSYGTFSIDATGAWTYTLNDSKPAVQALNVGGSLHELVTVKTADGTSKVIDVTIEGANDAAVITGTATDRVREKGGIANGTAGAAMANGNLNATDVDNAATFVAQTDAAKSYGTFSIDATGAWTYTLNDNKAAVLALNSGDTLHELVTVKTADGTAKIVDITIEGANDKAVISGTTTGSTTEKGFGYSGVATATGDLDVADVDSAPTFVAQTNATKSYGRFSIDATGAWTYTLDDDNADVEALGIGDRLHDLVTVATADGTTRQIDITINGASGFDLTYLPPASGFIIQGDWMWDWAGSSVSSAGDVNGDGFADVIVGAPGGDDGGYGAGEAYVVFGRAAGFGAGDGTGRAVVDLTTLAPADGFIVQGNAAGDLAGFSVSSAGDVNGDGFFDMILGAWGPCDFDPGPEAYVVFGKASGFGAVDGTGRAVIDLSTFAPSDGFIVQGDAASDMGGHDVASAGDVNGDGFADVIVGAWIGDDGGVQAGEAYVVFGKASGFGTVDGTGRTVLDLTTFSPADGFIVQGDAANDFAGVSVSSAGDVNGDGFADLIVGARGGDDGGYNAGEAYVVFGTASGFGTVDGTGRAVIDLTDLGPAGGFIVQGDAARDYAGVNVSSVGDVNGDGFTDLIVGTLDGAFYAGEAYVVFGRASGFGTTVSGRAVIDLTTLVPTDGFIVQGDDAGVRSVSEAGDVNGDGFADLIVGADAAYVVFGKASGFGTVDGTGRAVLDLTNLAPADGFIVQGGAGVVSSAGDVNGDGFADLIVGVPYGDDGGSRAGEAYVLFGGAFGGSTTPVTTTGTSAAEILIGGLGDDILSGGGGADSIRGGAGNDRLTVSNLAFRSVDGGGGSDMLALRGSGRNFNFTTLADNKISNIETVDITGTGNNSLTLGFADIAAINDGDPFAFTVAHSHRALVVDGNAGDTLTLQDYDPDGAGGLAAATWTQVATGIGLDGSAGGAYNVFDLTRGGTVLASMAMNADITRIT